MHLVGAHPHEVKDRDHFVQLLKMGSDLLPPLGVPGGSQGSTTMMDENDNDNDDDDNGKCHRPRRHQGSDDDDDEVSGEEAGRGSGGASGRRSGAGAAAKGRAAAALPPGFALARAGDVEGLKKVVRGVEGGSRWDPRTAMDKNGSSALDWAAGEGRLEVCRWGGEACPDRGRTFSRKQPD